MRYFNSHTHTEYSNITAGLDSINKLPSLVKRAKELGLSGLAITNHDNLSEVVEINRMQKQLRKSEDDFTLAIGNEIYLVDAFSPEVKERQKYYHFILIAKDKIGYDAIIELSSRAWYRSAVQYMRRRVPTLKADIEEILPKAKGHIVATTACLGGEFSTLVNAEETQKAKDFLEWCRSQFGKDDFYIELQPSTSAEQIKFNSAALGYDGQFTIATDAHYQDEKDFPIFEAFMRSQQENREVQEFYQFARLMSPEEASDLMLKSISLEQIHLAFQNTEKIRQQIEFYDLEQKPFIPIVELAALDLTIPKESIELLKTNKYPTLKWAIESADEQTLYCINTCLNQLYERQLFNEIYLSRLEEEFDTFKFQSDELESNFFGYMNTIQHFLDLAWQIECAVGPSRGSASGSLLCYLMDIVQCDPIQYELPFWRFSNKVRTSPLDIDVDFQPSKRAELFEAIRKERGELGMTQVATYRTLTLKAAIGNAARGFRSDEFPKGLDPDISTYISSLIEVKRGFVASLKQTLYGDETMGFSINHNFLRECKQYPELLEIIEKFEGVIVGSSTHAAAVILFDEQDRLLNHCSLMRAPNGDLCTALDLHTVEEVGCYKYDFLLLSTLDIQATCFKLLQKDDVIPQELTIKECFRKYINPNTIDFDQPAIWEKLYNNEVLSIFQWDAQSGRKGILAAQPQNLFELTSLNGLIRLMTVDGEEDQIQRFVRFKKTPSLFESEMVQAGLDKNQRKIMHEELDKYNGCAATQESFMILSQKLAGYTLKEADFLRKIVAKKKMSEISAQKDFFFSQCGGTENVKDYLWKVIIAPSLGYGFSLNHALPYSIIGVQCILMGGILFHPIYWQTACLLQRSGALDGKIANYNKIAKAVSMLSKQGVNISPIYINKSERDFTLDVEKNMIYFGLSAVKGLKDKVAENIISMRPFESMLDFIVKTNADITSIVTLIKSGAFDGFGSRMEHIEILSKFKAGIKEKLNGQNYLMISRDGYWPKGEPELEMARRIFNFTQYLKQHEYLLDDTSCAFLDEVGYIHDGESIDKSAWKYYYDLMLKPMKTYLAVNQEEMVNTVNNGIVKEWRNKYFANDSIAQWEIETMGLCFAEHPLKAISEYDDFCDFDDLSQDPEIATIFQTKTGRSVPLYKLTIICGIVIAKDKLHSSITLLAPNGPIEVKFRKEQFAHYDSQISRQVGGKKKVVERSWLNRGVPLIIHGMRQDDLFLAKTYKNSPMSHTAYEIVDVSPTGKIEVQKDRKKGKEEEVDEG